MPQVDYDLDPNAPNEPEPQGGPGKGGGNCDNDGRDDGGDANNSQITMTLPAGLTIVP